MPGTKQRVQKQHLSCLSASHYGAVLTICCRKWGDIVLYKHCFLVVALHFRHRKCHSPFHTFQLQCVLQSDVIMKWQVKYKSTSALMQNSALRKQRFLSSCLSQRLLLTHTDTGFLGICCEMADAAWYRQWNLEFSQAWCSGLVIILKYRTPPPTLKHQKSH